MSSALEDRNRKSREGSREREILKSAGIIGSATMVSRILGYIRDMIIAKILGAEMSADAFFIAFKLPNLLRRLLAEGSLSASFIPVFTEHLEKKGKNEAGKLASNVFSLVSIVNVLITLIAILLAPGIVLIIAPGFYTNKVKFQLTVLLIRIVFPYSIFVSIVALFMGILNSLKHFVMPALAPAGLNIGMIFGALYLAPHLQKPTIGIALGVLVGGLIQLLMELPILIRKGISLYPDCSLNNQGTKRIVALMAPAALGLGVTQINIMIDTLLASFLPEGSISYLYYSNRLLQLPLALFGIALGTVLLPTFSSLVNQEKSDELLSTFSFSMRTIFFVTLPASIGLIVFRIPIISLLFLRGEFTKNAAIATAQALFAYSVGLCAFSGLKVIIPVFYAHQDTITPVRVGVLTMIVNICLNIILMFPLKHAGLALGTSLSSLLNLALLFWIMKKRWKKIDGRRLLKSSVKILINTLIMGIFCHFFISKKVWMYLLPGMILWKSVYLFLGILFGIGIYLGMSYMTNSEELAFLLAHFSAKSLS